MAALADITVKKADGTTDIVYTGVVPSSGDKTPAVWRSNSVGSALAFRPELRLMTELTAKNTGRRFTATFSFPSVALDTTTSRSSVAQRGNFTLTGVIPLDMPDADVREYVYQGFNLLASALIKTSVSSGYAPS